MKKFTGNFTPNAGKVLKNSQRIICRVDEGGTVYITNGYFAFKLYPHEYAAAIQPAVCCEAGNWTMNNGEKTEEPPTFDLVKTFHDAVTAADAFEPLARCPLVLDRGKKDLTAALFYNAAHGFAALYDTRYLAALAPGYTLRAPSPNAGAVAYQSGEPFALILPVRGSDEITRAARAYFTQPGDNASKSDERRAELRDKLAAAEAECAALRSELDKARAAQAAAEQAAQRANETAAAAIADTVAPSPKTATPAAEPKTAAELIASRWSNVDGVTVTIKGAQTTSPVVWLTGDTDPHADEIKAQGGKWSSKRGAYYVRVA